MIEDFLNGDKTLLKHGKLPYMVNLRKRTTGLSYIKINHSFKIVTYSPNFEIFDPISVSIESLFFLMRVSIIF